MFTECLLSARSLDRLGNTETLSSWPDLTIMVHLGVDRTAQMGKLTPRGASRLAQGHLPGKAKEEVDKELQLVRKWTLSWSLTQGPDPLGRTPRSVSASREVWGPAWAGALGPWPWFSSFLKTLPNLFFLPKVFLHLPQGAWALQGLVTPPTACSAPVLSSDWSLLQIKPQTPAWPPGGNKK